MISETIINTICETIKNTICDKIKILISETIKIGISETIKSRIGETIKRQASYTVPLWEGRTHTSNCRRRCQEAKTLNWMWRVAGSFLQDREGPSKHWKVAALLYIMPAHHLIIGNMCLDYNKLKNHPCWMATFKKKKK